MKTNNGKKILIVDDDKIVLESCRRILVPEGYQVTLTSNASDAVKELKSKKYYDLLIMDVKMPEKDGLYLLDEIRKNWPPDKWPILPVLVISGYPTSDTLDELFRRGAKKFIPKPFTPDELLNAVNEVILNSIKGKANLRNN